jgi:hypothetical protein
MRTEAQREYQREWVKKNIESSRASKRRYLEKNRERMNAASRAYRLANRERLEAQKRQWERDNPELVSMATARKRVKAMNAKLNGDLKYHHDITLENYNSQLEKQGGVCAICLKFEITKHTKRLVVDHDHATGKIRGLLCHRCNCGLGYFKDDPMHIKKALEYLGNWAAV